MAKSSRRGKRSLPETPVELAINRLSHEGRGVSSINGKVAFVDGALPGEVVTARYVNSHSRYDELVVAQVIQPSPDRVEPLCRHFGVCGGCSLQHMSSQAQIHFKEDLLLEQLAHATGVAKSDLGVIGHLQAHTYHYRRRARLAVRYVAKKNGTLIGFRERGGSFITEMEECPVLDETVAQLIGPLRSLVDGLECRLGIPQFEVAVGESPVGVKRAALVMRHLELLSAADLEALRTFAAARQCDFYLQPAGPDSIRKLWPVDGSDRLYYRLPEFALTMAFHPTDFVQVNAAINLLAINLALGLLDLQPEDRVLDLFCGLGNFTLPIAQRCASVVGVEGSQDMVLRAAENAALNHIENASFHAANLAGPVTGQAWSAGRYTKVLLDPPRSGAWEVLDLVAASGAQKVIYISCNPATLARDAAGLIERGYRLQQAGVMDMFPHTAHVESIAEFQRVAK